MDSESKALLAAGIVWLTFIVSGVIGKPIKMSAIISVGGGFIVACVTAILASIFFKDGLIGIFALFFVIYIGWGLISRLFGQG